MGNKLNYSGTILGDHGIELGLIYECVRNWGRTPNGHFSGLFHTMTHNGLLMNAHVSTHNNKTRQDHCESWGCLQAEWEDGLFWSQIPCSYDPDASEHRQC